MTIRTTLICLLVLTVNLAAQKPPYDKPPAVKPPYHRVRYEASTKPGELIFPVQYTVWIPARVKTLRGVIVHQHGCGEGSCKSGQTGAWDLHWQALAKKHDCALLAPSYEQPQKADCQMWCDPRNGSGIAFQKALADLGKRSGHPELATVPWALWGHSGGGHWVGGMVMLHPKRVAAAWLRSGVPLFEVNPERKLIKPHALPKAALRVPMMCNPGTKEGVTVKDGRFAKVWPANEKFIKTVRARGGLLGVAVDGVLKIQNGPKKKGSILWTKKKYRDFIMQFEFRFGEGVVDSGVHVRNADQIQIGISGSLKRDMTCSPYIPGKGYPVEAKNIKKLLKPKGWNKMMIQAIGKEYKVWLQGELVMTYSSASAIAEGPIGIQLHGNRVMSIDYRKLTVAVLR